MERVQAERGVLTGGEGAVGDPLGRLGADQLDPCRLLATKEIEELLDGGRSWPAAPTTAADPVPPEPTGHRVDLVLLGHSDIDHDAAFDPPTPAPIPFDRTAPSLPLTRLRQRESNRVRHQPTRSAPHGSGRRAANLPEPVSGGGLFY